MIVSSNKQEKEITKFKELSDKYETELNKMIVSSNKQEKEITKFKEASDK
jgi:hypothetical protein